MKVINVLTDYDQINISSQRHVTKLIEEIEKNGITTESSIELNLEGCQTDYPETPRLIDFLLNNLSKLAGEKELLIKFDGLGTKEIYILYDIVLEGKYFDIHEKSESDDELNKWKDKINATLKSNNIKFKILYTPTNKEYIYG